MLIEVRLSEGPTRAGAPVAQTPALVEQALQMPNIALQGLMGLAPYTEQEAPIRRAFQTLRALFEQLPEANRLWLSMGMRPRLRDCHSGGRDHVRDRHGAVWRTQRTGRLTMKHHYPYEDEGYEQARPSLWARLKGWVSAGAEEDEDDPTLHPARIRPCAIGGSMRITSRFGARCRALRTRDSQRTA